MCIEKIDNLQKDLKNMENDLKTLTPAQREKKIVERENQSKNKYKIQVEAAYVKTLPENMQDLVKIKSNLENEIKHYNKQERIKRNNEQIMQYKKNKK